VKKPKKRHFVPRYVFASAFAGVVPVCATSACSTGTISSADSGVVRGVAAVAYCGFNNGPCGVAQVGFEASVRDRSADVEAGDEAIDDGSSGGESAATDAQDEG
jgi:hypothetical protein